MPTPPDAVPPALSRRVFLVSGAGLAGAMWLSACSGTSSTGGSAAGNGPGGSGGTQPKALIQIFDPNETFSVAGKPQRFPFGLAGADATPLKEVPASLEFTVTPQGGSASAPLVVGRHNDGVPIGYFPLRFTPDKPGVYEVATTVDGARLTASMQVGTATTAKMPQVGDKLVVVDTPTPADHRGVEPICTRTPQACPLHEPNLRDAASSGKPVALLISTPQFCQIGVCGPVLELFIEQHANRPGMTMLHAEVYKNAQAAGGFASADPAPVMTAYNLSYEPALFVARADGTIVERLDFVFDRSEIAAALDKANG